MQATSFRRQVIVAVLVAFALIGAAIRYFAPNPSLARDMGNLLLVLWVPAIGNVIAFLVNKAKARSAPPVPPGFSDGQPFAPQLLVELTPFAPHLRSALRRLDPQQDQCTLVTGTDGFTARIAQPLASWLSQGQPLGVELEFLRPELGLPRFAAGTGFRLLAGTTVVGEGRVLRALG
jgi:hypothetical protein